MRSPVLATARLALRPPRQADVVALTAVMQAEDIRRMIGHVGVYTPVEAAAFITQARQDWAGPARQVWLLWDGDALLGQLSLTTRLVEPGEATIGMWMATTGRGQGYLPEAIPAVLAWGFDPAGGNYSAVNWYAYSTNLRSQHRAQQMGFRLQGSIGQGLLGWNTRGPVVHGRLRVGEAPVPQRWPVGDANITN